MKKPLPLLIGTIICANIFLGSGAPTTAHHISLQKLFGVSIAHAEEAATVKYTCPMHPQIIADGPGKCPICGMDLVPIASSSNAPVHEEKSDMGGQSSPQGSADRKILYWYDPMVPDKRFDKPGKSPFMDMELVPKYASETSGMSEGSKPVISINADTVQKMGVRIEKVTLGSFAQSLRATGIVMENERARWDLFSQVEGRIDNLQHSAVGDPVKKGELFYRIYSPELLALQNDYLAARKSGLSDLAQAAKKRMKLLGVDDSVMADIAKSGKAYDQVPFYIPADGILARLEIRNGHYLKANDEIGHIQNLSSVWIEAALPEKDIPAVKVGDMASITVSGGTQTTEGKVDYIYPTIDAEARTGKIRLIVDNKDGLLRPASYATVDFATGQASERLTVSSEAILRDSRGEHVIVALGDGKFQAHDVKTGVVSAGRTEILSGLQENDMVVTSAQFLIDSESSLQESLGKLSGGK
jgi:Cu(I)/Ag(I) efflux system membrane fusion protein